MKRTITIMSACLIGALPLLLSGLARGELGAAELVRKSESDLQQGRIAAAITELEAAADRGLYHPELSFNRGVSYQRRVGTANERPSDLGQAAAAFAEVLAFRPSDAEAARGLEEAQLAVARRNSKGKGTEGSQVSSPLGLFERALLSFSPTVLFYAAALGSLILTVGVGFSFSRVESRRLTGRIVSGIGALIFVPCFLLFFARSALFSDAKMAVVIVPQAHLRAESGKTQAGRSPLVESTLVYVKGPARGMVRLVGLAGEDYLTLDQVRVVSHNPL